MRSPHRGKGPHLLLSDGLSLLLSPTNKNSFLSGADRSLPARVSADDRSAWNGPWQVPVAGVGRGGEGRPARGFRERQWRGPALAHYVKVWSGGFGGTKTSRARPPPLNRVARVRGRGEAVGLPRAPVLR